MFSVLAEGLIMAPPIRSHSCGMQGSWGPVTSWPIGVAVWSFLHHVSRRGEGDGKGFQRGN